MKTLFAAPGQTAGAIVTVWVESESSPGQTYRVSIVRAKVGDHAGQLYLTCSCPAGRYSWSPRGYVPCKHVRVVVKAAQIVLAAGHFDEMPDLLLPAVAS